MSGKSHPLRLLFVAARYFPYIGGVETHVYEVARRLVHAGVEVTVLSTDVSGQLPTTEEVEGVLIRRVRAWPRNKDYYFAPDIYRVISQGTWDLLHCQGYHTLVPPLAMLAALQARIPYVVTFHSGGDSSSFRRAFRGGQRMALRPLLARAERLIGPSRWESEFFRTRLRLPSRQFLVIPNGADRLAALPGTRERTREAPRILSIGRLERYKGHQRVMAALPKVQEQFPKLRLRIVGTGPYESTLHKLARKLGVAEYVEIQSIPLGDRDGMASVIAQADLVTLLSEYESQGIVVLEALALKRPVLVAATSALQEFADLGLARAIPLESTPEEVAEAIVSQLRQPLVPMNVELPTWDACATDLLALYHSIVGGAACAS